MLKKSLSHLPTHVPQTHLQPGFFLAAVGIVWCGVVVPSLSNAAGDETAGLQPILVVHEADWSGMIPRDSHLLVRPGAIEAFLAALDRARPDWPLVYGAGHHDEKLDDRLFQLNRERDELRKQSAALSRRITFRWSGTLSPYDPVRGGFPVAIGPEFTKTSWGVVRFKPEELPGNLTATAGAGLRDRLTDHMKKGQPVDLDVAITGRLIPEESVVYDFSHDEEGQGLIMPVVRVELVQYILVEPR